ncbi:MAG: LytS/YhcK type 5TM receptor domain-containing protein [Pseudomonadota bacterium]
MFWGRLLWPMLPPLRDRIASRWQAKDVLAVFWGCVVVLQMNPPLSPVDGVIVDMRNVLIILASAFLGLRGLCIRLAIAVGTRTFLTA